MSEPKWTEEQEKAIKIENCNALVSASAGSGKTAVMIERMKKLILEEKAEVSNILATTFTTLAANQIKDKLTKAIKKELPNKPHLKKQLDDIAYANISTIHSFCGNLIRNYFYLLGVESNYKILEEINQTDLQNTALENLFNRMYEDNNADFLFLVENYFSFRSDANLKQKVLNIYNYIITEAEPIEFLHKSQQNYTEQGLEKLIKAFLYDVNQELEDIKFALLDLQPKISYYTKINEQINALLKIVNGLKDCTFLKAKTFCEENKIPDKTRESKEEKETYAEYWDIINRIKTPLKNIYADFKAFYQYFYEEKENYLKIYDIYTKLAFLVEEFKKEYDLLKQENNYLDFNDLEHYTIKLLKDEETANEIKQKFSYIFVDEYQDVNPAQEYIIKRLENNNLFLVGDIKQSIYGFRGCDSTLFTNTQKLYQQTSFGTNLQLTKNFRSASNVINSVNNIFVDIISEKHGGYDYKEFPMEYGEGYSDFIGKSQSILHNLAKPTVQKTTPTSIYDLTQNINPIITVDENETEGTVIAELIKNLVGKNYYSSKSGTTKKINYSDIVILYKQKSSNVERILKGLSENGIKAQIKLKNDTTFYPEIQMLTDLLQLINSHGLQSIPLITGLKWIGNITDEELVTIKKSGTDKNFVKLVKNYNADDLIYKKLQNYFKILKSLILKSEVADASEVIADLIAKTNLEARLGAEYYGGDKIKRLYNFMNFAKGYSLQDYLNKLALQEFNFGTISGNDNCVSLMTIHSSKGLEFPVVILAGCGVNFDFKEIENSKENDIFYDRDFGISIQYRDSAQKVIYPYNALNQYLLRKRKKQLLLEQIRLFYVALTRAENHLFLVGKSKPLKKSIYPFEIYSAKCYFDFIKEKDLQTKTVTETTLTKGKILTNDVIIGQENKEVSSIIKNNLEFTYPNLDVVPLKKSVSNVSFEEHNIYDITEEFGSSSAEKGTAYHKFLELWNFKENYLDYYLGKAKQDFTPEEYAFLEQEKLEKICNMQVFDMVKDYSLYKEKDFFVGVPYNLISNETSDKKVIVQGTIDLLAIKDNKAVIIDYKLSQIAKDQDLVDKYKTQLALYAYAVKTLLNLDVECYLVNILSQRLIKLEDKYLKLGNQ